MGEPRGASTTSRGRGAPRRAEPGPAGGGPPRGGPAPGPGRGGKRQDSGHRPADRLPGGPRRGPAADPGRHLHQQGGRRDGAARGGDPRQPPRRRAPPAGRHLPLDLRARAPGRDPSPRLSPVLRDLRRGRPAGPRPGVLQGARPRRARPRAGGGGRPDLAGQEPAPRSPEEVEEGARGPRERGRGAALRPVRGPAPGAGARSTSTTSWA